MYVEIYYEKWFLYIKKGCFKFKKKISWFFIIIYYYYMSKKIFKNVILNWIFFGIIVMFENYYVIECFF